MLTLTNWAARWGIPQAAIDELSALSVVGGETDATTEGGVQSRVRLEAVQKRIYLWRNNVGAGKLAESGRFIRFGLANDSAQLNERLKSADLIGLRPLHITSGMVGRVVGQFVSREVKEPTFRPDGSKRYLAQQAWATLVNLNGGDAKIVTGPGSFD